MPFSVLIKCGSINSDRVAAYNELTALVCSRDLQLEGLSKGAKKDHVYTGWSGDPNSTGSICCGFVANLFAKTSRQQI